MPGVRLDVRADLVVEVELTEGTIVRGHLRDESGDLVLTLDRPEAFAGAGDAGTVRQVADELARHGMRLHIEAEGGRRLLSLGAVRGPWWQRPVTRSRNLRVGHVRGLLASARGRASAAEPVLPTADLRPPTTLYPLAPTFLRRPVRRVTTTHDPHRGGLPRLVMVPGDGIWVPEEPVFWLQRAVTTIGSDPSCDIVLAGLLPHHAEVVHSDDDEFVLVAAGPAKVHGRPTGRALLRTAARVELGDHVLAFMREEYADHGRPYGGRIGGELGRQRTQPPRGKAPS